MCIEFSSKRVVTKALVPNGSFFLNLETIIFYLSGNSLQDKEMSASPQWGHRKRYKLSRGLTLPLTKKAFLLYVCPSIH